MAMSKKVTTKKEAPKEPERMLGIEYSKTLDAIPKFYVNNTNASFSNFDLRLTLGQIADVSDDKILVDPQVVVFMSPEHAKAVVAILSRQIETYEKNNGVIPHRKRD
jgi:hypothetical protein